MLVACEPTANPPASQTIQNNAPLFPTMTLGRVFNVPMPTLSANSGSSLSNPATAIALSNQPTATPNYASCPPINDAAVMPEFVVTNARELQDLIGAFLNSGGSITVLEQTLREHFQAINDEQGFINASIDLTGEGVPEILLGYTAPDGQSILTVFGCADGRILRRYESVHAGEAPTLLNTGDLNLDGMPDVFFTSRNCTTPNNDATCTYTSELVAWDQTRGRYINLVSGELVSQSEPSIEDFDQDRISEIIIRLENSGNSETGPLRTGFTVYDWDGAVYRSALTQLDPPRYRIQVMQAADARLASGNSPEAIQLYNVALESATLTNWYPDDATILRAYGLYRLVTMYAFQESPLLEETFTRLTHEFPDPALSPVYVEMTLRFWDALQVTNNIRSACTAALDIATLRPEAVDLLNRYGSESPTYTTAQLCPF